MNRLDRLKKAIEYLTNNGYIHFQTDIAKRMDSHPQPVSKACKGDERYLTDKFLVRFNTAFGNIFNIDWLQNGNGEMLSPDPTPQSVVNSQNTVKNNSSLSIGNTDMEKELLKMIERKDEQIKEQAQQITALLQILGERK